MIAKDVLKQVLASNQKDVERYEMVSRALPADDFPCQAICARHVLGHYYYEEIILLLVVLKSVFCCYLL